MLSNRRRLRFERLELRRVLNGAPAAAATVSVDIPENLTGQPGGQVIAPVNIDNAAGIRGAEVRIRYDTSLLDADSSSVRAGSAWPQGSAAVVVNVNDATGSIVAFVFTANELPAGRGSLLDVHFAVRGGAAAGNTAIVDLTRVRLNEGAIVPRPDPVPGPDATDGRITAADASRAAKQQPDPIAAIISLQQRQTVEQPATSVATRNSTEADSPRAVATRTLPLHATAWTKIRRTATHAENNAPESSPGQAASIALASVFSRPKRPASVDLAFSTQEPWLPARWPIPI